MVYKYIKVKCIAKGREGNMKAYFYKVKDNYYEY